MINKLENLIDAVVQIPSSGGRGVLVGEIILTAAHCVTFSTNGEMVLGDFFIEEIETRRGRRLKVRPLAVEPVADIAALGCLDDQQFYEEVEAFEDFCHATTPMPIAGVCMPCHQALGVCVLNANGQWVSGEAKLFNDSLPGIWIEADEEIKGGASGGPIINRRGELIAIVSHSSVPTSGIKATGVCPRPLKALPQWVCENFLRQRTRRSSGNAREKVKALVEQAQSH
jgi:hypothetical protein